MIEVEAVDMVQATPSNSISSIIPLIGIIVSGSLDE
jgi:hypothetical protein